MIIEIDQICFVFLKIMYIFQVQVVYTVLYRPTGDVLNTSIVLLSSPHFHNRVVQKKSFLR